MTYLYTSATKKDPPSTSFKHDSARGSWALNSPMQTGRRLIDFKLLLGHGHEPCACWIISRSWHPPGTQPGKVDNKKIDININSYII